MTKKKKDEVDVDKLEVGDTIPARGEVEPQAFVSQPEGTVVGRLAVAPSPSGVLVTRNTNPGETNYARPANRPHQTTVLARPDEPVKDIPPPTRVGAHGHRLQEDGKYRHRDDEDAVSRKELDKEKATRRKEAAKRRKDGE